MLSPRRRLVSAAGRSAPAQPRSRVGGRRHVAGVLTQRSGVLPQLLQRRSHRGRLGSSATRARSTGLASQASADLSRQRLGDPMFSIFMSQAQTARPRDMLNSRVTTPTTNSPSVAVVEEPRQLGVLAATAIGHQPIEHTVSAGGRNAGTARHPPPGDCTSG
jgi:hypothetical protein